MNNQIEHIAMLAGFSKDKYGLYWDDDANTEGVDLERFAKLLIQECFELVQYNSKGAGDNIKNHFGIDSSCSFCGAASGDSCDPKCMWSEE